MNKRRQFHIDSHINHLIYEPMVDKHLEYYFASRNHRRILIRSKLINRKNEIIDHSLTKLVQQGTIPLANSFRLKKIPALKTMELRNHTLSKTLGKLEFDAYIKRQRKQLEEKKIQATEEEQSPIKLKTQGKKHKRNSKRKQSANASENHHSHH